MLFLLITAAMGCLLSAFSAANLGYSIRTHRKNEDTVP